MEVAKLSSAVSLSTSGFSQGVGKVCSGFSRMGAGAIAMNQGIQLLQSALGGLKKLMDANSNALLQAGTSAGAARVKMGLMFGSVEEGKKLFKEMQALSAKVPFQFEDILASAARLTTIVKGGAKEIAEYEKVVLGISAIFNKDVESVTNNVIRLYTSGGNAARQFKIEGITQSLGLVGKSATETRKILMDMIKDPQSLLSQASIVMANSWGGLMSMMKDKWYQFRLSIMDAGLMDYLKGVFLNWNKYLDDTKDKTDDLAKAISEKLVVFIEQAAVGIAKFADAAIPALKSVVGAINTMWQGFMAMPEFVREYGLVGAIVGGAKFRYLLVMLSGVSGLVSKIATGAARMATVSTAFQQKKLTQQEVDMLYQSTPEQVDAYLQNKGIISAPATKKGSYEGTIANIFAKDNALKASTEAQKRVNDAINKTKGFSKGEAQDKKDEKAAEDLQKKYDDALESLLKLQTAASSDTLAAGMRDYAKAIQGVDTEIAKLASEFESKGIYNGKIYNETLNLRETLIEKVNAEYINKIKFESEDIEQQTKLIGVASEQGKAEAETLYQFRSLLVLYPEAITQVEKLIKAKKEYIAATNLQNAKDQVSAANMVNSFAFNRVGKSDRDRAISSVWESAMPSLQQAGTQEEFDKLYDEYNKLADAQARAFDIWVVDGYVSNVTKLTDVTSNIRGAFESMVAPMQEVLTTFAQTGKFAGKEFVRSLMKELQAFAAQKTAQLLMEAAFCGVMGLIKTASNDSASAGKYYAAASQALAGAAMMGSFVAGSGLSAMGHKGIESVPEDGTWLLQKNERVVDSKTNADLKEYLKNGQKQGVVLNVTINGGDQKSVTESLPKLRQMILDTINGDIASNGVTRKTIIQYA
jgi:hypothetical protein